MTSCGRRAVAARSSRTAWRVRRRRRQMSNAKRIAIGDGGPSRHEQPSLRGTSVRQALTSAVSSCGADRQADVELVSVVVSLVAGTRQGANVVESLVLDEVDASVSVSVSVDDDVLSVVDE